MMAHPLLEASDTQDVWKKLSLEVVGQGWEHLWAPWGLALSLRIDWVGSIIFTEDTDLPFSGVKWQVRKGSQSLNLAGRVNSQSPGEDRFDRLARGQKPALEEISILLKGKSDLAFIYIQPGMWACWSVAATGAWDRWLPGHIPVPRWGSAVTVF